MPSDLKGLVAELQRVLAERGSLLDAHTLDTMTTQIENLKRAIDEADAAEHRRLRVDALNVVAALISVITNVTTLLK